MIKRKLSTQISWPERWETRCWPRRRLGSREASRANAHLSMLAALLERGLLQKEFCEIACGHTDRLHIRQNLLCDRLSQPTAEMVDALIFLQDHKADLRHIGETLTEQRRLLYFAFFFLPSGTPRKSLCWLPASASFLSALSSHIPMNSF